ncbi:DUF11 domain-containing protein [Roseivivax sp. GX 12232]|uniref:DUF11 domain-containing protein n=1 Tax=Roseivivax sp. GX 12232 TaxID=2900547 RepID=UPI001E4271C9|nr:DUF11 domain-containing protein [Roseivivax sp. GX 12232]MCE0505864.1 DUF11 domain-containing protein [Roseivivax sp. GX 12232]
MPHRALRRSLLCALSSTALAGAAQAAGTAPGTSVSSSVSISYSSGGTTITQEDAASVAFVVDRKVDFSFQGQAAGDAVLAAQGAEGQTMVFRLENEGNDASGYDIDIATSGEIGLDFDAAGGGAPGSYSVYVGDSPEVAPEDALYDIAGTANLGDLAADAVRFVKVVAHIPGSAADGATDAFDVTATALDPGTDTVTTEIRGQGLQGIDTILTDPGEDGLELQSERYVVQAPQLSALKEAAVISENLDGGFDCGSDPADPAAEAAVPGACVEYTISVTNAAEASSDAVNVTITDALPEGITYAGTAATTGFDRVNEAGGTVTAELAALAPGATASFRIRAVVD